jgi:flagellar biosynthesis protein FliR
VDLLIHFILLGAVGGALRLLLHTDTLMGALSYANSKWVLVGAISGLAYYFLYSDYNFPNSFMALVTGYAGADIIEVGSRKLSRILHELLKA